MKWNLSSWYKPDDFGILPMGSIACELHLFIQIDKDIAAVCLDPKGLGQRDETRRNFKISEESFWKNGRFFGL
ncbi:hypothetical protein [Bacillus atrophaeus]|uniref:hypothetical protein n=1 Tax=Bacillus atrophaeus TaxID=1452 RepID=UPI00227F0C02|nr:hypothetical protein [Bacillus atrophaeus]MCY8933413.1 hypothetical protein [Bacillus atrophaeus]MCY8945837.1 hypothetical protein [Bacillus atrophaeus]MEC0832727.1 hypothetical protein [Bacillus atrophaeus]MEC0907683.1 hypothetical protein [Bacillus atrophaeus]MEC0991887.1 hypothetical protein [Bacillus atrophaeus]